MRGPLCRTSELLSKGGQPGGQQGRWLETQESNWLEGQQSQRSDETAGVQNKQWARNETVGVQSPEVVV